MLNKNTSKLIILVFLFIFNHTFAQQAINDSSKYGGYIGFNFNSHTANFTKLPGIPNCCPRFEEGSGTGFNLGILYEYKIAKDFWIGSRLGIINLDGTLTRTENTTLNTSTGSMDGEFEHKVQASFMNIGFEPSIIYNPFKDLFLNAGFRLGSNITNTYSQSETIIQPLGQGTFIDENGIDTKQRTRNVNSGDLQEVIALQFGLTFGLSYELPLNKSKSFRLSPEISYLLSMTNTIQDSTWKINSLRGGVAIKYVPQSEVEIKEIFEQRYEIDTIVVLSDLVKNSQIKLGIEAKQVTLNQEDNKLISTEIITRTDTLFNPNKYNLSGEIRAVGLNSNNQEIEIPQIQIEEFISNRLDPLLNYIFFDENSSDITTRYYKINKSEINKFDIKNLFRDSTLSIYHNILNILGKRLTENPNAKINLVGCNSDFEKEEGNLKLSENRAISVKNYLTNIWQIDEKRIKVDFRNLPIKSSLPKNQLDKIEENRRVEIYSDDSKILEPIFIEKIDRSSNPPVIRFKTDVKSDLPISELQIFAYQNSEQMKSFEYQSSKLENYYDWQLEANQNSIPKLQEPVLYYLALKDTKGNEFISKEMNINIDLVTVQEKRKEMIGDFEIERFSLILFDFNKSEIEGNNNLIIQFIKNRIKPNSEIEITGYTDRTGESKYNKTLSEKRAETTQKALEIENSKYKGLGSEIILFNNNLPEGRFYCRTVNIIVKTKIN